MGGIGRYDRNRKSHLKASERRAVREKICQLRAEGRTYKQISEEINLPLGQIEYYAKQVANKQKVHQVDIQTLRANEFFLKQDYLYSCCLESFRHCKDTGEELPGVNYLKLAAAIQNIAKDVIDLGKARKNAATVTTENKTTNITINADNRYQELLQLVKESEPTPENIVIDAPENNA